MVNGWEPTKVREHGDEVWFEPSDRRYREPRFVVLQSVGRKYLRTACGLRVEKQNGWATSDNGNYSQGRCYESREAHERIQVANREWKVFRDAVANSWQVPAGIDAVDIRSAMVALRLAAEK